MATTYAIKDWDTTFEDYRSREVDNLSFLKFPLHQDSESFRRLMRSKAGQAAYGIFCALVQIAGKGKSGERGILRDDRGPMTPGRIASRIGCSEGNAIEAISLLSAPHIGWLVVIESTDGPPTDHRSDTDAPPPLCNSTVIPDRKTKPKDHSAPPPPDPLPAGLDTPEVRKAVSDFEQHRIEIGHPLTPLARTKLVKRLEALGPASAVYEINRSIENQWRGVGPWPDERSTTNGTHHSNPSNRKSHAPSGSSGDRAAERRAARARRDFAEPALGIPILNAPPRTLGAGGQPPEIPQGQPPQAP